jgi:CheY-like chemotaxis protein
MTSPTPPNLKMVLLVDDNDDHRVATKWFLANFGFAVDSARSAEEALAVFDPAIHDAVVTDNSMPGMNGAEMAHVIKMRSPHTPVIMYSGMPPCNQSCLDVVIRRPAHLLDLKDALDQVLSASKCPPKTDSPSSSS